MLFFVISCSAPKKPEGLILKVQFQPEKTYSITTIRGTETTVSYSGEDIAMRKLKSMHVQNPTISKVKTKTEAELVTGKKSELGKIPVVLTYKKILSLDDQNEIPEGTVIKGEITGKDLPAFNTVVSGLSGFDQKIKLLETIRKSFEQFNFPEKELNIGDEFSTDRPVSIPMQNSTIEIIVTTTCKLTAISNHVAEFDLNQTYLMTPVMLDNTFTGKGSGQGKFTYDITNSMVTDYSLKTILDINKKLDYYQFDLKTVNEFSQQIKPEKK